MNSIDRIDWTMDERRKLAVRKRLQTECLIKELKDPGRTERALEEFIQKFNKLMDDAPRKPSMPIEPGPIEMEFLLALLQDVGGNLIAMAEALKEFIEKIEG